MIKPLITIACLCIALAVVSSADAQQKKQSELEELWLKVKDRYSGIKKKQSAIKAALANEKVIQERSLPQFKTQAQNVYGTHNGVTGAFFPQPGLFNVSGLPKEMDGAAFSPNVFGSVTVEWNLFSFGKQRIDNKAAHTLTHQKKDEKATYLLQLKKKLSLRYIRLLYDEAKLTWNKKNLKRLQDIRNITAGLSASGMRPAADSLLALSSYTQALSNNDKLEGNKYAALYKVQELVGNDFDKESSSVQLFLSPTHPFSTSTEMSMNKKHPLLEQLKSKEAYYSLSSEAEHRAALPTVQLLGGYSYRGTGIDPNGRVSGKWTKGFSNQENNYLLGIGISWNITKLHTHHLLQEKFFHKAEETKHLHQQYEQALTANLLATQAKIQKQFQQVKKTQHAVQQAQEAYKMYMARYKSGLIDLNELLQTQLLLVRAENNQIEVARDYWTLVAERATLTSDFTFLFKNL